MLTKAYHLLKARGDKFEVLFVSNDKSSEVRAARGLHRSEGGRRRTSEGSRGDKRGAQRGLTSGRAFVPPRCHADTHEAVFNASTALHRLAAVRVRRPSAAFEMRFGENFDI